MTRTLPLRGAVLLLLVATLFVGAPRAPVSGTPLLLRAWGADGAAAAIAQARPALAGATRPSVTVRRDAAAPSAAELDLLGALARTTPLLVALPARGGVHVEPPALPRSERAAAIAFTAHASPGDSITARLFDGAGVVDSVRLVASRAGRVAGAFRVRPVRAGWHDWEVEVAGARQRTGVWVREAAAPRVLVAAGPPTWESRFILRALDEAGAATAALLPLGRGLHAGDGGAALPTDPERLAEYDAIIVLPGASLGAAARQALEPFVAAGGGVIGVGRPDVWQAFGLAERAAGEAEIAAGSVGWTLPAELVPLPAGEVRTPVLRLGVGGAGAFVAARDGESPLLTLRPFGHGRAAALGVLETWRWRMEAGQIAEHREFWRGFVDWIAGDGAPSPRLRLAAGGGAVGAPAAVEVYGDAEGTAGGAPALRLERPDGSSERLLATAEPLGGAAWRVAFVPADTGVYRIAPESGATSVAYRAVADGAPADDAAARLTLLAHASGGAAVAADSVRPWLDARAAALGPTPAAPWLRWLLFAALLAAAFAEWTIRRLGGAR